jgi:GH15 family glucan-1,4-alpha-glucosidase
MNAAVPMPNLDLAVIGNSVISALVDPQGRIVWLCWPRLDGDPVFCSLLDGPLREDGAGFFEIGLENLASATQSYEHNTAVLTTTLVDNAGASVRITDVVPRFKQYGRIFRPTMLLRHVEPLTGTPRIRIRLRPRFDYGAAGPTRTFGSNHVRFLSPTTTLRLTTDAPISYIAEESAFVLAAPMSLILGPDEGFAANIADTAREFRERTQEYWQEWVRYLSVPFEWQDAVIRAAITLKLCSFEETGGIVAALTTSIPEAPETGRTWDYRYCWLRDAYFVVHALNRLGATLTMENYIRYITNVAVSETDGRLKPVYRVVPGKPLPEWIVEHLAGYRGMGPVRVGNLAEQQVQNDVYGSVVLAAAQMFFDRRLPQPGDAALFHRLEHLGELAAASAFQPDAGLWEFRGRRDVHTFCSVMCWVACDRLAKIARALGLESRSAHWRRTADELHATISERGFNKQLNSFVSTLGGKDIDACLLLLQEVGFVSATDPRFLGTVAAVERVLRRGNHLLRYVAPDDFGVPTTAFTICTFWYIDALVAIGRKDEARTIFEEVLRCRNHVGLLSEDIDPKTGDLWGNFPQTYSMVGLIVSAMRLSKSWEESFWRGW